MRQTSKQPEAMKQFLAGCMSANTLLDEVVFNPGAVRYGLVYVVGLTDKTVSLGTRPSGRAIHTAPISSVYSITKYAKSQL
jgi:hypothetical protein